MGNSNKKTNVQDFTTGNIFTKLLRFMLPILGALILQTMYSTVDLLVVGQFGTKMGLSGVTTGSNIINLVMFTVTALAMGATVLIGRYLGEGRQNRLSEVMGGVIAFFTAAAVLFTILLPLLAEPLARLMQAPEEALTETVQYIRICGGGISFVIAYNVISCIFRGMGDSTRPLIFVAIACVVNIFGDLLLVAVFHMDVVGAAIATIAAQAVSVVLSLVIMKKIKLPFHVSVKDLRFNSEVKKFVKIGSPLAVQELLTQFTFLALCAFINRLGIDASSGYGIAQRLQGFVMLIPSAIMQSMAAFVAQNVGAGKEKRATQAMLCGMGVGAGIGVVIACGCFFFGDSLARLFTSDTAVIGRAFEYLRGFAPEAIVTSILFSYIGYFNGHSNSVFVMAQGLLQSFLVRLPMSYVMSIQPNASLTYIGLAAPTATVFGIILCTWMFVRMKRKMQQNAA